MSLHKFQQFFDCCVGTWKTERTYHYLTHQEVERSRTEFTIQPLIFDLKVKVLADNGRTPPSNLAQLPGYHLGFQTISEKGEQVSQQLNMLFVPTDSDSPVLQGDYLRDRAYEEAKPIVAHFRFDTKTQELLMTTHYTRVVSVDSITLINPELRIRKIVNYQRPAEGKPLENVVLVGFGVEQKAV
ncbi:phycobiliprotein lyase [Microcoleus sp. FACHB-672]|uniref:phycobiliprotein lyase n=1 Tax=Microcoleus sp. FACHB-672 TaxID=2692825 RepID=UPI00168790E0|nr:phycobiliprotein lyase [Microcoleus sp. FACHB-672]MBD2042463.1 phycobiliprotein lyase [Microcoleus sp. FACHB-672]